MEEQMEAADKFEDEIPIPESVKEENELVMRHILDDKRGQPNKYASHWEMDEEDVEAWTQEEIDQDPEKMILWAAENGKTDVVQKMISESPDLVNARDSDGYTPLHRAAYGGHYETANSLISLGADVMARSNEGWTPLHSAAHWDQRGMCELLLNLGAEPNAMTNGGNTPLHVACVNCQTPMTISYLLRWPYTRQDIRNAQGDTPKDIALRHSAFARELFGP